MRDVLVGAQEAVHRNMRQTTLADVVFQNQGQVRLVFFARNRYFDHD